MACVLVPRAGQSNLGNSHYGIKSIRGIDVFAALSRHIAARVRTGSSVHYAVVV